MPGHGGGLIGTMGLNGRTVLITGAAGDIGQAVARLAAARGARVLLADLQSERLTALSRELVAPAVACDLMHAAEAQQALADLAEAHGADALVAAAGMNTRTPLLDLPVSEWDNVQAINLRGSFLASQAVARSMVRAGRSGSLVFVGSIGAWQPYENLSHYEVAKAGVHALVRAWSAALASHGIRVNAVAPGVIDTTMTKSTLANPLSRRDRLARIPLARFGTTTDVAEAACFLLSDAAEWITGTTLTVDGGQSVGSGGRPSQC